MTFHVRLLSLSMMFSGSIHIVTGVSTSSMFIAGYYSGYRYIQINYILFVQYGHLVCFYLLAFRASLIAQLVKNQVCKVGKESVFNSWVGKTHWRKDRLPTPVFLGFPCGSAGKEFACNVGGLDSMPGLGRSPGEGKGYPLQYSALENSMDYMADGVAKSRTHLSHFHLASL